MSYTRKPVGDLKYGDVLKLCPGVVVLGTYATWMKNEEGKMVKKRVIVVGKPGFVPSFIIWSFDGRIKVKDDGVTVNKKMRKK